MRPLPKSYDPKETEQRWQEHWRQECTYRWHDDRPREQTFVIDTPPPTVSGLLHMGHIFSYTQADFVARYQRMAGKDVFYPMGFDDNGLPTERLVEKVKGIQAHRYIQEHGREAFVKLCQEVVKGAEEEFRTLFRSVALSVDWEQEYQTISPDVRALSQASFIDLLAKGEAYRKLQPMLWDPVDQTAIAQAEIVDKEMASHFVDIYFGVEGSDERIVIATTRPELIGACVAVFYHPEDARYRHLKGKTSITPLFGIKVPIHEDDEVQMEKGTGLVMCCTFGDETDIHWWEKHDLPMRVILNKYGKIDFEGVTRDAIATSLQGLKAEAARKKSIELLKEAGLLANPPKPITHVVKCAERSGAALEILPTHQWFVKVLDKKDALKAKAAQCAWHPEYMKVRMDQWIDGLSWDWCISRQRFFGVPFPVWYGFKVPVNEVYTTPNNLEVFTADLTQLPVDPLTTIPSRFTKIVPKMKQGAEWLKYQGLLTESLLNETVVEDKITKEKYLIWPDLDVMDTWATSSLTPQISAKTLCSPLGGERPRPSAEHEGRGVGGVGAAGNTPHASASASGLASAAPPQGGSRFHKLFPADLRPQAHEIIRTWAFYTIVKAHLHADTIPWKHLMISGWCLAADKTKMSKSKGNVVTPVALIEDKGADAVRYWASTSRLGADTAFSEDVLKIGRKLVTKLWNATNFAAINLAKLERTPASAKDGVITHTLDRWILSRLHKTVTKATEEFERFEYCDARVAVEDFFWNDFCDNYLELAKARAYEGDASALHTLYHCLEALLRLFAPFVPHVTEELYSHLFEDQWNATGSVHARGMWPSADAYPEDAAAEQQGAAALALLEAIRKAKSERNVSIKFPLRSVRVAPASAEAPALPADLLKDIAGAASAGAVTPFATLPESVPLTSDGAWRIDIEFAEEEGGKTAAN